LLFYTVAFRCHGVRYGVQFVQRAGGRILSGRSKTVSPRHVAARSARGSSAGRADLGVNHRADKRLEDSAWRLPDGLTYHKLRQAFGSILVTLGQDPAYVMEQLGHINPAAVALNL
jgi:hypothetical protein